MPCGSVYQRNLQELLNNSDMLSAYGLEFGSKKISTLEKVISLMKHIYYSNITKPGVLLRNSRNIKLVENKHSDPRHIKFCNFINGVPRCQFHGVLGLASVCANLH